MLGNEKRASKVNCFMTAAFLKKNILQRISLLITFTSYSHNTTKHLTKSGGFKCSVNQCCQIPLEFLRGHMKLLFSFSFNYTLVFNRFTGKHPCCRSTCLHNTESLTVSGLQVCSRLCTRWSTTFFAPRTSLMSNFPRVGQIKVILILILFSQTAL